MQKTEHIELDQESFYEGLKSLTNSDLKSKQLLQDLIEAQQEEVEAGIQHKKAKRKNSGAGSNGEAAQEIYASTKAQYEEC